MRLALWAALLGVTAGGCVTSNVQTRSSRLLLPDHSPGDTASNQEGVSASLSTQWLGSIPYDDDSLPLFQPDGEFLAVRVGTPPSEAIAHGRHGRQVTEVARIAVHSVTPDLPRLYALEGRYLLGRGVSSAGFLIEEPRVDGTRRIGLVAWESGEIDWLVDDEFVNAFANIAENGTLAYARRGVDDEPFDLVVERYDTTTVFKSEWERSWIDPVFSADGTTLFALRLGDGTLELGWKRLPASLSIDETIHTRALSDRVNTRIAHQALASQTGLEASPQSTAACLVFRHPELKRLVHWTLDDDLVRPFPPGVFAATMIDENHAVVSRGETVELVSLPKVAGRMPRSLVLLEGLNIPRRNGHADDSVLLLQPRNGTYSLIRLDLFDVR